MTPMRRRPAQPWGLTRRPRPQVQRPPAATALASYLDFVIDEVAIALIASGRAKLQQRRRWTFAARQRRAGGHGGGEGRGEVEAMDVDELSDGAEVERRGARAPSDHRSRHRQRRGRSV